MLRPGFFPLAGDIYDAGTSASGGDVPSPMLCSGAIAVEAIFEND